MLDFTFFFHIDACSPAMTALIPKKNKEEKGTH